MAGAVVLFGGHFAFAILVLGMREGFSGRFVFFLVGFWDGDYDCDSDCDLLERGKDESSQEEYWMMGPTYPFRIDVLYWHCGH